MLKGIGKIFDFFKFIGKILTFNFEWGDETVEKHPKLDRFYQKGFWARLLLFVLSLIITAVTLAVIYGFWGVVFGGELIILLLLVPLMLLLGIPTKFTLNLAGIGIYHFKSGVQRTLKKVKTHIKEEIKERREEREQKEKLKELNSQNVEVKDATVSTSVEQETDNKSTVEETKVEEKKTESNVQTETKKPKARSIPSLIFALFEIVFTFAMPLSVVVIAFCGATLFG